MFWGNLLGEDTPAGKAVAYLSNEFVEVEEFVNAIKAKQAELEEKSSDQHSSKPEIAETAKTNDIDKADTDKAPQQAELIEPESIATEEVVVENKTEVASNPVESQPVIEQQQLESIGLESIEPESTEPESIATEEVVVDHKTEVASNTVEPQPVIQQAPVYISDSQNEQPEKHNAIAIIDSKDELKQVNDPAFAASQESDTVNKTLFALDETNKTAAMAVTYRDTEETFVPAEIEKQLSNVDEHGEVIDASQPSCAVRENWITARKSFYQRNYELSEQSYQQVIDSTKNNYDAYGELGNVYFNQGKNKQAASSYFEAAAILVSKGQINRARSLTGLLRYLDKSKATELQKLIDSTKL